MKKLSLFSWFYLFIILLLFLYSYTQVDLNLTFSRVPLLHTIIHTFQYIGYFQRPISTTIYVGITILLFIFYYFFLKKIKKSELKRGEVWTVISVSGVILLFSYNAFSYDLFNYIFDAKIFTFYHQNPYLHKALDFHGDPMLTFMRWTHRTYPYGPVWLFITVPLSYLGFQFFIPTFLFFKLLALGGYYGTAYYLEKITKKYTKVDSLVAVVFFALNPLVLIESVVSAHIDISMVFLLVLSVYYLLDTKSYRSILLLVLSIGVKYASVFIIPAYIYLYFLRSRKILSKSIFLHLCLFLMAAGAVAQTASQGNFQPWYLLIALPFAAILAENIFIIIATFIISFIALMGYVPYLFLGNWNPPVPALLFSLYSMGFALMVVSMLAVKLHLLGKKA